MWFGLEALLVCVGGWGRNCEWKGGVKEGEIGEGDAVFEAAKVGEWGHRGLNQLLFACPSDSVPEPKARDLEPHPSNHGFWERVSPSATPSLPRLYAEIQTLRDSFCNSPFLLFFSFFAFLNFVSSFDLLAILSFDSFFLLLENSGCVLNCGNMASFPFHWWGLLVLIRNLNQMRVCSIQLWLLSCTATFGVQMLCV